MKDLIIWNNQEDPRPIEMTVGLPALNAKKIIWLPLESLRRQKKIDFGWELLIWEEDGESLKVVESFIGKLPNCQRIIYRSIDPEIDGRQTGSFQGKFILIDKWLGMAQLADSESRIFVFQDADDYSPPKRLWIHYQHFQNPDCLYSTQTKGLFINLRNQKKIFFDGWVKENNSEFLTWNHLNKAVLTQDLMKVPTTNRNRGIDTYIRNCIEKNRQISFREKKYIFEDSEIDPENWKYGFFTDGQNNISRSRLKYYSEPQYVFFPFCERKSFEYTCLKEYIPKRVRNFIKTFREN